MGCKIAIDCLFWTLSILLLIIALSFFSGLLGLATAGIISAQIEDQRIATTGGLDSSGEMEDVGITITLDDPTNVWLYYMYGATAASLPYSIFGTLAMIMIVNSIRKTRKDMKEHKESTHKKGTDHTDDIPLRELSPTSPTAPTEENFKDGSLEGRIDYVQGEPLFHFHGANLAPTSFIAIISVFFSLLLSCLSLLGILWGIAIAFDHARRVDKQVYIYILVELLVGLITPILAVIAASIFSIFLEYITQGSIDSRVIITRFLPVVKLVKGDNHQYWTIFDRFYFELSPHDVSSREEDDDDDGKYVHCSRYCSRTPATWILAIIVSLAFLLAVSYFMNQNITQQITVQQCPHQSVEVDCFNETNFDYVDCDDPEIANSTFELLHCFRFLRFGRDSDIIGGLSRSFAFYLATLVFFSSAFHVADILINFQPSKLWGIGFVVLSVLMTGAGLTIMFTEEAVLLRVDIIQTIQVYFVAIFIFLIGLLLLIGKWWQRLSEPGKGKPGRVALEHFGEHSSKKEVKRFGHMIQDKEKEEDKKAGHTTNV